LSDLAGSATDPGSAADAGGTLASGAEAPRDDATRAFEALADLSDAPPSAGHPDEDDFSWETGAGRPDGPGAPPADGRQPQP
jgi:hypothetical protein